MPGPFRALAGVDPGENLDQYYHILVVVGCKREASE